MTLLLTGCAKKATRGVLPVRSLPTVARIGSAETGIASWYGYPYHGRRAANGEIYDMEAFTAAHRTLPFGTWVAVKRLDTEKIVRVRITDRGPFAAGRVIDLSKAAARSIDMLGPGLARVRVVVVAPPPVEPTAIAVALPPPIVFATEIPAVAEPVPVYAVQVAALQDRVRAENIRAALQLRFGSAELVMRAGSVPVWRVLAGKLATMEEANTLAEQLRSEYGQAFVVRVDDPGAVPDRR